MLNVITKVLSIHPILSLLIVGLYIFSLWACSAIVWMAGHPLMAVFLFIVVTSNTKKYAGFIIGEVSRRRTLGRHQ